MGWMKVPEEVLDEYNIDEDRDLNNHFAWPGFTSASRDTMATWDNRKSFCKDCNVLFMIDQDEGTGPVDISGVSKYPRECEVMHALGQQFKKLRKFPADFDTLVQHLGQPPRRQREAYDMGPVTLAHLRTVGAFYVLARDLFKAGGTVKEAFPIIEKRLLGEA